MPEIGNLFVTLSAESAQFNRGLADANKKLAGFGNQFAALGKNINSTIAGIGAAFAALGGGAAISAIAGWAKGMAEAGESAVNLANAMGLTLQQTVDLQGVFQLTTGSLEGASGAMRIFIGHIADAMAQAGPARESFARLGISLADLQAKGRDPLEMLKLVAERMKGFQNDAVKAALGADLFGKSWEKIAPAMDGGAAAMDGAIAKARELDPAATAAKEAGDKLDKKFDELNKSATGLSNEGLLLLESKLDATVRWLIDVTNWASQATAGLRGLDNSAKAFATTWAGSVLNVISKLPSVSMWSVIRDKLGLPGRDDLAAQPDATANVPPAATLTAPDGRPKLAPAKGGGKGGGGKDDSEKLAREAERARAKLQREQIQAAEEESRISDALFRRKEQAIKNDVALDKLTKEEGITAERKLLDEKWVATSGFYTKKKTAALADADETRSILAAEQLDYIRFLTERDQLIADHAKNQHDTWKEAFSDMAGALKSNLESIFDSLMAGTFKLRDAIGSLLKDIGKKLASKGFDLLFDKLGSALFSSGGPIGKLFGFQSGGSFRVGGAGALDSQLVAFRASPGEMVDVHKNGAGRGGGSDLVRIELNPSEGWVAGVADQRIVTHSGTIIDVAVRQSQKTVARNFGGMSAEAQTRTM